MPDSNYTEATHPNESGGPQRIGKYRLTNKLGEGEFGYVYEAVLGDNGSKEQSNTQARFAIKMLKSPYAKNYRTLAKEFSILQELSHPSLAKWFEMGVSSPTDTFAKVPYLVAEFTPGESWVKLQQRSQISSETLIRWAYEITSVVQYLHTREILHGDLRPHNIQVTWHVQRGQTIKIMDVGLGKLRRNIRDVGNKPEVLRYLSPEQFDRKPNSKAAEMYVLGLLLYELCSRGSYPYEANVRDFIQWKQVHQNHQPKEFPGNIIPNHITQGIMRCLDKDPTKRPTADQLLSLLEQEISGVGISSYIGILGARGSGKTCYLTSLYGQVQPTQETKNILEQRYIDLYEKGSLPPANALMAHRLNFKFNTATRYYDIVTKDYGGELLEGRRENLPAGVDQELLQERRQEIYEFFQNARAILILVEAYPKQDNLRKQMDSRNEIYSLLERIAVEHSGRRQIEVPICIVLTKWDRSKQPSEWAKIGKMDEVTEKACLEEEHKQALAYIEKTDWLRELYRDIKLLCPLLEVFPAFSFIGDHPSKDDIRPFNIKFPLIWATDQSDIALAQKCEQFQQEHGNEFRNLIEMHWRLLNVEKICDADIRKQMQAAMVKLSPSYFQNIQQKIQTLPGDSSWAIGQYQEFLQTKGIQENEKQQAQRELDKWRQILAAQQRVQAIKNIVQMIASFLLAVMLIYLAWEGLAEYQIRVAVTSFEQQGSSQELVNKLNKYLDYRNLSPIRGWRSEAIQALCREKIHAYIQRESSSYKWYMEETLNAPPNLPTGDNLTIIEQEINNAKQELQRYEIRIQKIKEFLEKQKSWLELFAPILGNQLGITTTEIERRTQSIKEGQRKWEYHLKSLDVKYKAFLEKDKLVQEFKTLTTTFSSIASDDRPAKCEKDLQEAEQLFGKSKILDNEVKNFLLAYPDSIFKDEIRNVEEALTQHLIKCRDYTNNLDNVKKAFQSKLDLARSKTTLLSDMAKAKLSASPVTCEKDWEIAKRFQQEIIQLQEKLQSYATAHPTVPEEFLIEIKQMKDDLSAEKNVWDHYSQTLAYTVTTFRAKQKLLQETGVFFAQIKSGLIGNKPEDWDQSALHIQNILQNLTHQQTLAQEYVEKYSDSSFVEEIKKLNQEITSQISFCQSKLSNLKVLQQLYQEYRTLLTDAELTPKESDSVGILREKKDKIAQTITSCHQLQQKLATNQHILPDEIARRWPNECDEIMPKLQDNIRRCHYFMAELDLREIQSAGKILETDADTPQTLDEKSAIVKTAMDNIYKYDTSSSKFLPEDMAKLTAHKKNYYDELTQIKISLEQRKMRLEEESLKCQEYLQQWRQEIQKNRSYEVGISKLEEWQVKANKAKYLADRYQKQLEEAIAQAKQFRDADLAQYNEILAYVKQFQFINAFQKIGKVYVQSNNHLQVMKHDFGTYIANFKCDVELALRELPNGIENNGPDIELNVTVFEGDKTGAMTAVYPRTEFYNDNVTQEVLVAKFTVSMKVAPYKLLIEVKERDNFGSDDYGSCTIELTEVLNNNNVGTTHQCKNDGSIKFTVVPMKMLPKNEFPPFRK